MNIRGNKALEQCTEINTSFALGFSGEEELPS
jgi:hypothetical protein